MRLMALLVNPVVRRILASPAHDLLGPHLAVLGMTGRRTGRTIAVPVRVMDDDDGLVALSRSDRRWWRNLRGGAPVTVLAGGRRRRGRATVDHAISTEHVTALVARAYAEAGHPVSPEKARERTPGRVVVRITADPAPADLAPLRGRPLWRRWTATVTAGEALAFSVPAVAGALLTSTGARWPVVVPVTLLAGAWEGVILGFAQALVLRRAVPSVPTRAWLRATVAGALVAWTIGLVPVVAGDRLGDLPPAVQAVLFVVLGGALVTSIGLFQWRVLREHVDRARLWVPATAAAWLLGLAVFMAVASPLWHEGQATALVVAIGIAGGCAMAATVAALTGAALARLLGSG